MLRFIAQVVHGSVKILLDGCVGVSCNTRSCRSQLNAVKRKDSQVVFHYFLEWLYFLECALRTCILVVNEHAEELFRVGITIQ